MQGSMSERLQILQISLSFAIFRTFVSFLFGEGMEIWKYGPQLGVNSLISKLPCFEMIADLVVLSVSNTTWVQTFKKKWRWIPLSSDLAIKMARNADGKTLQQLFEEDAKTQLHQDIRAKVSDKESFDRGRMETLKNYHFPPSEAEKKVASVKRDMSTIRKKDDGSHNWTHGTPGTENYDEGNSLGNDPNHCDACREYHQANQELRATEPGICTLL